MQIKEAEVRISFKDFILTVYAVYLIQVLSLHCIKSWKNFLPSMMFTQQSKMCFNGFALNTLWIYTIQVPKL